MSKTPQERVSRWLNDPLVDLADTEVREAIRAVLAELQQVKAHYTAAREREGMWADERDALRAEIARRDHVAHVNASWRPDR